jgi:serine protease Do
MRHAAFLLALLLAAPVLALPVMAEDAVEKQSREDDAAVEAAARAAADKVSPAIVEVETIGAMPEKVEEPKEDPNGPGGSAEGVLVKKGFKQAFGPSTGVAVGPELVITSSFAVKREPRHIFVTRSDGKSFVATILGKDEARMLVLLKVPGADLKPAKDCKRDDIKAGRFALAMGKGYGVEKPTVSQGIVSAVSRAQGRAIQTCAHVSPACYGGPLVSIDGEVMGVLVPLAGMGGQAGVELYDCGIGFAIPMDDVRAILPRLEKGETLKPGFLGIQIDQGRTEDGVLIEVVQPESAAEKAGLKDGDLVIEVDGKTVKTQYDLLSGIGRHSAGDKITLTVDRKGVIAEYEGVLGEQPANVGHPNLKLPGMPQPGPGPGPNPPGGPGGGDEGEKH